MNGLWAGVFHAGYWLLSLYIHRKDVLEPETIFADAKPIPFNRLMLIRLIHFGMLGFCGLLVAFFTLIAQQAIILNDSSPQTPNPANTISEKK